ncbi:inositol monophosphatase family protein [Marinicrinis sediminis]|uniref:Inositol monophosphatase family protein n=1 Tax=Marinicrinis sediminis TaxID=1652465 RepID=A0ABW5R822_9BACL
MEASLLAKAKTAASDAAVAAGQIARQHFGHEIISTEKDKFGDLVTHVDHLAEQKILTILMQQFPDHHLYSEESGHVGPDSEWMWLIDPLDGTHNYAVGLPLYGVVITLLYQQQPRLGVIYDSVLDRLYIGEQGHGTTCNGAPIPLKPLHYHNRLKAPTAGWVQGYQVQQDPIAKRIRHQMEKQCKRVLNLWAPSLLWVMLARGDLDAIVVYQTEEEDLYAGVLIAQEAGAVITDFQGNSFTGMLDEPCLVAALPDQHEHILHLVQAVLGSA